jgi:N-acetylneuraminic acid mutarotase
MQIEQVKYQQQTNLPQPCQGHSAVIYNEEMYVFGGRINTANGRGREYTNTMYKYSLKDKIWTLINCTNSPTPRHNHTAIVYNDQMIIYGGSNNDSYLSEVYSFRFVTNDWELWNCSGYTEELVRHGHTACLNGNQMVVFGGKQGVQSTLFFNDVFILDLDSREWKKIDCIGNPPSPRCWHSATLMGNLMIVFGGFMYNGISELYYNDTFAFDIDQFQWNTIQTTKSPAKRNRQSCTSINEDEIILFGGNYLSINDVFLDDIWKFNLKDSSWIRVEYKGIKIKRGHHTALLTPDRDSILLFGGEELRKRFNDMYTIKL